MLLECSNCGAPLDVQGAARRAKCNYCGQATPVAKLERVADETPEGWQPPKEWSPPANSRLAGQSLAYKPIRAVGRAVALGIRLAIVAIVGSVAWRGTVIVNEFRNALPSHNQAEVHGAINQAIGQMTQQINAAQQAAAIPEGPITCNGSDTLTVKGRILSVESPGVAVTATGNCRIKLVGCRLGGASAVVARDNARVTIEGGALTGGKAAVALSSNAALEVTGGTLITGVPAVAAIGNSRAILRDASVNGAIDTRENASVDATGAKLLGGVTGTKRVKK